MNKMAGLISNMSIKINVNSLNVPNKEKLAQWIKAGPNYMLSIRNSFY